MKVQNWSYAPPPPADSKADKTVKTTFLRKRNTKYEMLARYKHTKYIKQKCNYENYVKLKATILNSKICNQFQIIENCSTNLYGNTKLWMKNLYLTISGEYFRHKTKKWPDCIV